MYLINIFKSLILIISYFQTSKKFFIFYKELNPLIKKIKNDFVFNYNNISQFLSYITIMLLFSCIDT